MEIKAADVAVLLILMLCGFLVIYEKLSSEFFIVVLVAVLAYFGVKINRMRKG